MIQIEYAPTRLIAAVASAVSLIPLTAACSGGPSSAPGTSAAPPTVSTSAAGAPMAGPLKIADPYSPTIDPSAFSTKFDNPYFPLVPGTRSIYEATTADGLQRTTTEVTRDTKQIMGVNTVAVHDAVSIDGTLHEDTIDWYAQDHDGNVWYFGEATKEFDGDKVNTSGSFEAGVDGAVPGIIMPGHPQVGDQYRQEYAKGIAEDRGDVIGLTGTETSKLTGPMKDLLVTKDVDLLDPSGPAENKYYARGIGLILTVQVTGPPNRDEAIAVEKF
jgi:hypothetical protein